MKIEIWNGSIEYQKDLGNKLDIQWYWHIRARNGRIIADGSEGYDSKGNALRAVKRLIKGFAGPVPVVVLE